MCLHTGSIPSTWGNQGAFSQLLVLDLTANRLSGSLPASWPPDLQSLSLGFNQLNGTLPADYGLLTRLEELLLAGNYLTGQLPEEWGHPNAFPQLFVMDLGSNSLTGPLPASWGNQTAFQNLLQLSIDNNHITGTLPEDWASVGAFPLLQELDFSFDRLQGAIPTSWTASSAFANMQILNLQNSYVQGQLPSFHNSNLRLLDVGGCPLNSSLNDLWNSTSPLQLVTLANASLFGPLPDIPRALEDARVLDLSYNQLTGTLPLSWLQAGGILSHVTYLDIGHVWTTSVSTSSWRQQLCLQKNLYDNDTTGEQASLLPVLRSNLSSVAFNSHENGITVARAQWLQSASYISSVAESTLLANGNTNQLTSVRDICANHDSHVVLLIVWLVLGVCCLFGLTVYACMRLHTSHKGPVHLGPKSFVQRNKALVSSFYEAFAGLAGLAFYYYDLITSIIVLRQVWGLWPSKVLLAIFLLHFATTGVIVAFHALYRLIKLRYDVSQSGFRLFGCILAMSLASGPFMIVVVLLLDTFAFIRQFFKAVRYIVRLPGLKWLDSGYVVAFKLHHCIRPVDVLGLSWVDLESYESMHNFVAAVFQSLPTVILNSVLYSTGNKPSHGIFLSSELFLAAVVASCLAMFRVLVVTLWQSFRLEQGIFDYVASLVIGKTLAGEEEVKSAQSAQVNHVALLVQQYEISGSAPLGSANHNHASSVP